MCVFFRRGELSLDEFSQQNQTEIREGRKKPVYFDDTGYSRGSHRNAISVLSRRIPEVLLVSLRNCFVTVVPISHRIRAIYAVVLRHLSVVPRGHQNPIHMS